jgi:hypothetical protein
MYEENTNVNDKNASISLVIGQMRKQGYSDIVFFFPFFFID